MKKSVAEISGFVNNLKPLGENAAFSIAYSVQNAEGKFDTIWVNARSVKGVSLEGTDKKLCQFKGFLVPHVYEKDGKDISSMEFVVQEVSVLENAKDGKNKFVVSGYTANLKELKNGSIVGSLSTKVKDKDGKEHLGFIPFIAKKGLEFSAKTLVTAEGFFSGDAYKSKDGKDKTSPKLFIMKSEVVPVPEKEVAKEALKKPAKKKDSEPGK